jgi:hypothetical protein
MRAYQFDATRLALLRDGMRRGVGLAPGEVEQTLTEERQLLSAIAAYRNVFAGRDPYAPRAVWDGDNYQVTFPDGVVRTLDAPEQPVVPVPLAPVGPGAPPPSYAPPAGYSAPPGYGPPGGYGPPSGFGAPAGYVPPQVNPPPPTGYERPAPQNPDAGG